MRPEPVPFLAAVSLVLVVGCGQPEVPRCGSSFSGAEPTALPPSLAARLREPTASETLSGAEGWLYHADAAAFLLADRIGPHGPAGDASTDPDDTDPLAVVVDFRDQLQRAGRDLIVVPIPDKLAIYPEPLLGAALEPAPSRLDGAAWRFYRRLAARGVQVVDLTPCFLAERRPDPDHLFPPGNSHWSSRGCLLAAREVAAAIRVRLGLRPPGRLAPLVQRWIEEPSDLLRGRIRSERPVDRVLLRQVPSSPPLEPVQDGGRNPVLLLGDSNLLFLTGERSGFPHLLGRELGFATPQIAVQAGGPTGVRQRLARLPHRLEGKRLVVWILASRHLAAGPPWRRVELPPLPPLPAVEGAPR